MLGSIPSAYLVTRRLIGRDIRQMGGGNVGGLNTFREVGTGAGISVAFIDLVKGTLAVSVSYYLLTQNAQWVILTGFMAVIGHNWSVWLDFKGGKGWGRHSGQCCSCCLFTVFPNSWVYWHCWFLYL
ncbi:putative membrane protein [Dehalococcoides mccartyi]|uniref:Putative membrane protein n=1 Tax=Dehalococcoides mccartyi TaxID=61435 RepID=A0A328ERI5_9CHLR|nr:putative membrane protein [Dehalococcoides mccartyi]